MECVRYLEDSNVVLELKGRTHGEVIFELVNTICRGNSTDKNQILQSIYAVEDIKNTAVGKGVAIPHGRTDAIRSVKLAFGRSEQGVSWGSPDGNPVRMVWLILNPNDQSDEYLNVLSQITKISCRKECREAIMRAKNPDEVMKIIRESKARNHARK
jgi:mannitol/fructose-specific phosphotransferase system IIA component (Ntr-type)